MPPQLLALSAGAADSSSRDTFLTNQLEVRVWSSAGSATLRVTLRLQGCVRWLQHEIQAHIGAVLCAELRTRLTLLSFLRSGQSAVVTHHHEMFQFERSPAEAGCGMDEREVTRSLLDSGFFILGTKRLFLHPDACASAISSPIFITVIVVIVNVNTSQQSNATAPQNYH